MTYNKTRFNQLVARAAEDLANHTLDARSTDRHFVLRPSTVRSAFSTIEVVTGYTGSIVVFGDVDLVEFSHFGSNEPHELLKWMGRCTDIGYYVAQKANLGGAEAYHFDPKQAKEYLEQLLTEYENDSDSQEIIKNALDASMHEKGRDILGWYLYEEGLYDLELDTDVLQYKVIVAHAAVRRVCDLLGL